MSSRATRVLLIEDNPGDARLVELALAESPAEPFELGMVNRLSHALDSLARTQYDVVLLDLTLPDCAPRQTVERVAAAAPALPIVVLTGFEDELFSREVVKLGAQDYLVKGQFDNRLLARSLCYAIDRKKSQLELAHARDAAIEAGGLKARFLANMSHEIRTPMNAIIGMTRMLLDTPLAGEQREFADAIWNSAYALLALINDILEISKLSAGKVTLRSVEFSPTSVVEGVVEMFAEKIRTRDVRLASFVDGNVPALVRGDPGRLRQVLVNLVGNAAKFTEHGEITIELTRESESPASSVLRFVVTDSGPGIPLEAQDKLFSPFYQADDSSTRQHGGTGLGLAISSQIVEFMGGKIELESAPGKGATFRFSAEFEHGPEKPRTEAELRASLKNTRVLIVEAPGLGARFMRRQLESWGLVCECADYAEAALTMLSQAVRAGTPYALVILDADLADNLSLPEKVRAQTVSAPPRIAIGYALGRRPDEFAMRQAGIAGSFPRPTRQSQLYDCLAGALGRPSVERPQNSAPGADRAAPRAVARAISAATRDRARILLAEDHKVNEMVVTRMLSRLGLAADVAHNGREAIEMVLARDYGLVLMDCQMPEVDGYAATRTIRSHQLARQPAIVALTAHALEGDREKCLAAGMDDYLSKPVLPDDLMRVVERWLANSEPLPMAPGADKSMATASSANEPPPIDPAAIARLGGNGDDEFVRRMIAVFLPDLDERLKSIREAYAAVDATGVRQAAHALKGSCSHFGAKALVGICADIERASGAGELNNISAELDRLLSEAARVRLALEAYGDSHAARD